MKINKWQVYVALSICLPLYINLHHYHSRPLNRLVGLQQEVTCSLLNPDHLLPVCWEQAKRGFQWVAQSKIPGDILLSPMGTDSGRHFVRMDPHLKQPCVFYSFGIADDYSFDTSLAQATGCLGFLFDPTVQKNSVLPPSNLFFGIGANMLDDTLSPWVHVSPVQLPPVFGHSQIFALKLDCEGCEYALARDIEKYDQTFLKKLDQLVLETHMSRVWLKDDYHFIALGVLYDMLRKEGFKLVFQSLDPCGAHDEAAGCHPVFSTLEYPCQPGQMCANFVFVKQ